MRKSLAAMVVLSISTAPAAAQTRPHTAPVEKPKTVTKVVCERVSNGETTGSRVRATSKQCKKVEVPVEASGKQSHKSHAPSPSGH